MKKLGILKNRNLYASMSKEELLEAQQRNDFDFSAFVDSELLRKERKLKKINDVSKGVKTKDNEFFFRNNLKGLKQAPKVYDIESFDVETVGRGNYFYLCGFIDKYGEYKYSFDKLESIKLISRNKHFGGLVYATNLGFDFNSLAEGTDFKTRCNILIRGSNYIMVTYKGTYQKIKLLDSVNYGGLSVEKMGNILKLPKLKKPKCLGRLPKNKKEKDELLEYNKRDCEVTRDFMIFLQKGLNDLGGELKSTISSCAMDLFRRRFLKYDVVRESVILGYDVKPIIYKAYYGGRTEVFKRGFIENYNYYDFNSLYPSVMLFDYPNPLSVRVEKKENRDLLRFEGVSYFELDIPKTRYPLLPYREGTKLIFPYGKLKGYYTHLEIRRAIELYGENIILLMNDTVYYTETKKYFEDYVNTLYTLRKEYKKQGSEMEHVVKLLLNSLYGRFALRKIEKTEFIDFSDEEEAIEKIKECEKKGITVKCDSSLSGYFQENEDFDGVSSVPIWSVYVTAYARTKLHSAILECDPVYIDTDSLITKKKYKDSKELGELKLEKVVKNGIIIKPKLYFCDDEIKSKGVPIPKNQRGKERLKKQILSKKTLHYKKFIKVKEGINRNIKVNSVIVQSKEIDLEDNKRVWVGEFDAHKLQDSEPIEVK